MTSSPLVVADTVTTPDTGLPALGEVIVADGRVAAWSTVTPMRCPTRLPVGSKTSAANVWAPGGYASVFHVQMRWLDDSISGFVRRGFPSTVKTMGPAFAPPMSTFTETVPSTVSPFPGLRICVPVAALSTMTLVESCLAFPGLSKAIAVTVYVLSGQRPSAVFHDREKLASAVFASVPSRTCPA